MARYTNAAIAAALSLLSLHSTAAWTTNTNIQSVNVARTSTQSAFAKPKSSALNAGNPYASLESSIVGSKSLTDAAAQAQAQIVASSSSIFAPIQGFLSQIIETERALNNMEHTAVSNAAKALLSILNAFDDLTSSISSSIIHGIPSETLKTIVSTSIEAAKKYATSMDDALLANPAVGPILTAIQAKAMALSPIIGSEIASLPPSVGILASAAITYGIVSTTLSIGEGPPPSSPYPLGRYDPSGARAYFDKRPADVIARGVEIGALSAQFGLALLSDYLGDKLEVNADRRGQELALLLTNLGPTFSKFTLYVRV